MSTPKFRLVSIDDWCCLYVDGRDVYQGHSLQIWKLMEILKEHGIKIDFAEVQSGPLDEEAANDQGQLPQNVVGLKDTDVS